MTRSSMFTRVALAVALLVVSATLADAQDREGRRGGRGFGRFGRGGFTRTIDKLRLAQADQVQSEIKVTEEQKSKIDEIVASYREESRGLFTGLGNFREMSDEERSEAMASFRKKQEKLVATFGKKIDGVLEKAQVKRLNEIALQQKGVQALTDAPVAAALKLSEEQVGKIKAVFKSQEEAAQKLREGLRGRGREGGREAFAEYREKTENLRKESEAKALAVLSEEQQKQFVAMKGKEFELDRRALFRRGGRGGFRGGDGEGRRGRGEGGGRRGGGERRRPPVDDA